MSNATTSAESVFKKVATIITSVQTGKFQPSTVILRRGGDVHYSVKESGSTQVQRDDKGDKSRE